MGYKSKTNVFLVYEGGLQTKLRPGSIRDWVITHDDEIDYGDLDRVMRLSRYIDGLIFEYYGNQAKGKFRVFIGQELQAREYAKQIRAGQVQPVETEYQEADW